MRGGLNDALSAASMDAVGRLAEVLFAAMTTRSHVFIAGNGGSADNAMHLANDFLYGMGRDRGVGLRVEALTANASILTCISVYGASAPGEIHDEASPTAGATLYAETKLGGERAARLATGSVVLRVATT